MADFHQPTLRVNNQRLGEALETLKREGAIVHTDRGWMAVRVAITKHNNNGDTASQPQNSGQAQQPSQYTLPI